MSSINEFVADVAALCAQYGVEPVLFVVDTPDGRAVVSALDPETAAAQLRDLADRHAAVDPDYRIHVAVEVEDDGEPPS